MPIDFIATETNKKIKGCKSAKKAIVSSRANASLDLGLSQKMGGVIEQIQENSFSSKAEINAIWSRKEPWIS